MIDLFDLIIIYFFATNRHLIRLDTYTSKESTRILFQYEMLNGNYFCIDSKVPYTVGICHWRSNKERRKRFKAQWSNNGSHIKYSETCALLRCSCHKTAHSDYIRKYTIVKTLFLRYLKKQQAIEIDEKDVKMSSWDTTFYLIQ